MTLETNSSFEKVSFDKEAKDWMFIFADSISIFVSGFWRLLENSKIILVSLDQGHQFGLPKPLNLVKHRDPPPLAVVVYSGLCRMLTFGV
ncbi:MAG: hypothetical protein P4L51_27465 [Puia sp.]|nr:hypothetical protein [Puia sp.]